MTTFQKSIVILALTASVGTGIYEARQASALRRQVQSIRQEQAPLLAELQNLAQERNDATNRLSKMADAISSLQGNSSELIKLRGEVAQLRNLSREWAVKAANTGGPDEKAVRAGVEKVKLLKQWLEQRPEKTIPEMQLLTLSDWMEAAGEATRLQTDFDYRGTFSGIRHRAKRRLVPILQTALNDYIKANNGQLPENLSQLKPYFNTPVDDGILERYKMIQAGRLTELPADPQGIKLVAEKSAVDSDYDVHYEIGLSSYSMTGVNQFWMVEVPTALAEYKKAHKGQAPTGPADLLPYFARPIQGEQLERLFQE